MVDGRYMREMAAKVKNWGKWGDDDEIGTLNYVQPDDIVNAATLIRRGKVFSLGMNFDFHGPQSGIRGRVNPVHTMSFTGTDALCGAQDDIKIHFADDYLTMPLQCATHWDALGHIFYKDPDTGKLYMYNGYSPAKVTALAGCTVCGIEKTRDKMVGRGVLLDIPRFRRVDFLHPDEGIDGDEMEACAKAQGIEVRVGDFLLVRTGDLGRRLREGDWGTFDAKDAPGVEFESIEWLVERKVAAIAMDTWGCEVQPNRSVEFVQPWHWLCIPMAGLTMGEMFKLDELADDCAADGRYEFFFAAPPLAITHGTGSPLNPQAIK
ncbi:MAG: cyclase family protein [Planctomycetota bacterium]|nr:cyclase family protein [Planctomycetota bacterium]